MRTDLAGPRTWLLAALAAWCLVALILALSGMGGRVDPMPADASMTQPLPRLPENPQERLGVLAEYSEISARPLFSSDRRPKPFFIAGDGSEPVQAFDYVLSSVLIAPGTQMAILQPTSGGDAVRVRVGESPPAMSGWQLVEVQPRSASFIGPEGPRTLELRVFDGRGGQAPTAVAPPPPPQGQEQEMRPEEPMAGPAPPGPAASARVPPVAPPPAAEPEGAPGEVATSDSLDPTGQPSELTTQQQMEAIRKRIEARRAQLRQTPPSPPPNKTQ